MSSDMSEERMLIDGALVRSSTGATYPTVNPATEETLGVAADAAPKTEPRRPISTGPWRRPGGRSTSRRGPPMWPCGCAACASSNRR